MILVEVNYDMTCEIYNFLKNYSDIYGLPSSERKLNKITMPIVFLPTNFSYASVYYDYTQAYKKQYGEKKCILSERTFRRTWKSLMPSLQFMSSKSNLCNTCEAMKLEIQYIIEHEKKISVTENYLAHLSRAKEERNYYNNNITLAVEGS
ncbi:unnamed protein product [Rhizophagus irregularis]|nr:unnamed protein product [Rhizophagus irregularis]